MSESSEDGYYRNENEHRRGGRRPQVLRNDFYGSSANSDVSSDGSSSSMASWGHTRPSGHDHIPPRERCFYPDSELEDYHTAMRSRERERHNTYNEPLYLNHPFYPDPRYGARNWDGVQPQSARRQRGWESESESEYGDEESEAGSRGYGGYGSEGYEDSEAGTPSSEGRGSRDYFSDQSDRSYTYRQRAGQRDGRQRRGPQGPMSSRHGGDFGGGWGGQGRYDGGRGRGAGRSRLVPEEELSDDDF